jgi:hypothetical protein
MDVMWCVPASRTQEPEGELKDYRGSRFRVFYGPDGIFDRIACCTDHITTPYCVVLGSDDFINEDFIHVAASLLDKDPGAAAVSGQTLDCRTMTVDGREGINIIANLSNAITSHGVLSRLSDTAFVGHPS